MKQTETRTETIYRPVSFLLGTFFVTWLCALLMADMDYNTHPVFFYALDFPANASPLICALLLLQKPLLSRPSLTRFLLGKKDRPPRYLSVFALFVAQFLNFYCFRSPGTFTVSAPIPSCWENPTLQKTLTPCRKIPIPCQKLLSPPHKKKKNRLCGIASR